MVPKRLLVEPITAYFKLWHKKADTVKPRILDPGLDVKTFLGSLIGPGPIRGFTVLCIEITAKVKAIASFLKAVVQNMTAPKTLI